MKIDMNIKMDANTKVIVVWSIMLLIILFTLGWLVDKDGLIVINHYDNCSCPKSYIEPMYWNINEPIEFNNSFSLRDGCCYPSECGIPCEHENPSCTYAVACGTLEELGLE